VTGNPAAAAAAVAGAAVGVVLAVVVGLALRFPSIRSWLAARITAMLRFSQRVIKRPRSDPEQTVGDMLTMIGGLRLGWRTVAVALVAALLNWLTDVACLICALKAAGAGIPWSTILIVWTAGAGAASFSPSPAGIGVVDIVLIAALAGAGISPAIAVAAVLLYRIVTFKIIITMASLAYYRLRKPATSPPEESAALVRGVPDDRRESRENWHGRLAEHAVGDDEPVEGLRRFVGGLSAGLHRPGAIADRARGGDLSVQPQRRSHAERVGVPGEN
jgi:hypothetical protein